MTGRLPRPAVLSNPWLVTGLSVAALAVLILLLINPWSQPTIEPTKLRFYCAANATKAMEQIVQRYREQYGVEVEPTYDGSGKLLSTIAVTHGQGDLFLAADTTTMEKAKKDGWIAETIPVAILTPVIALHPRVQKALREHHQEVTGLADLFRSDLKVALANPELASIGLVVKTELEARGQWKELEKGMRDASARVSTVGTVVEAAAAVQHNDRTVSILWDAVADQFGLEKVPLPEFKDRIEYMWIGVLKQSRQPTAALQFARYLTARQRGQQILREFGYKVMPDADDWAERPEILLSAGAMLQPAISDTLERFEKREGAQIKVSYMGCGLLVSQMKALKASGEGEGGNFPDAYFACDTSFLDQVRQWYGPQVNVASNDIVLIRRQGDQRTRDVKGLDALLRTDLRIGLCDPVNSALGALTDQLLEKLQLRDRVYAAKRSQPIVHVDAAHLLVTQMRQGALDLAVVYRSNAKAAPGALEKEIEIVELGLKQAVATQPFAIAQSSRHQYLVGRLRDALTSRESERHFEKLGFHWQAGK
jgi:molybdenum ABC transporter molybdate-binding protein